MASRPMGFTRRTLYLIFAGGEWTRKGLDIAIGTLAKIPSPDGEIVRRRS